MDISLGNTFINSMGLSFKHTKGTTSRFQISFLGHTPKVRRIHFGPSLEFKVRTMVKLLVDARNVPNDSRLELDFGCSQC